MSWRRPVNVLVLGWLMVFTPATRAATSPDDLFFEAATLARAADAAETNADWPRAYAKYDAARAVLLQIRTAYPEWNTHVIEFRIRAYSDRLSQLQPRVPAELITPPPGPVPPPSPPPADTGAVTQLTEQLRQAEARLQQLKSTRQELIRRLESTQHETAAERDTAARRAADLQRLTAELTAARAELDRSRQAAATEKQAADREAAAVARSNAELAATRAQTEALTTQLNRTLRDLDQANQSAAQLAALAQQRAELTSQLAARDQAQQELAAELTAARAQVDELTATLATAPDRLDRTQETEQHERDRLAAELAATRAELDRVRQASGSLASADAHNTQLQRQLAAVTTQLEALRRRPPAVIVDVRDLLLETGAGAGANQP